MGFWKSFFGGETDAEEERKTAEEKNFDLLKYDGVKAMRMGQLEYAVKCFEKALQTKDDAETHDYLSRAYMRLDRMDEAMAELRKLMEREPDNVGLMLQAASVAYMAADYDAMAPMLQRAEELQPDNALVQLLYAKAALGQGDDVQAVARLTKAIALDEKAGDARLLRAQTLLAMGDMKGAEDDVEWLTENAEPNEDVLLAKARIRAAQGRIDEAIAVYGEVTELNPFCTEAFRERGALRMKKGDKDGAAEDMKTVMQLNPQETADVNGEYSAEGIEQKTRQAYSNMNPFGI